MTQEEKLLAGKVFDPVDPELVAVKRKAHNHCVDYGMTHEDEVEKRRAILEDMLKSVGENVRIQGPVFFNYGNHTSIGNNFFGNYNLAIQDDAPVTIGNRVNVGPNVTITTPSHPLIAEERIGFTANGVYYNHPCYAKPVVIEDGVWIGAGVTICGGVTIGEGAVIGAGSVVTRDIPPRTVAVGVPCKVLRQITDEDSMVN
ncbi:MAG: sugar O-acetyltransferase, partial [Firmicutes bacterium]|nr:sugar O-acetyltransferase [Bacillota bacterium]